MPLLHPLRASPFESREDLQRVLATLSENEMCSLLKQRSQDGDHEWIAAAMDAGLLDAESFLTGDVVLKPATAVRVWHARYQAVAHCLCRARVQPHGDPREHYAVVLPLKPDEAVAQALAITKVAEGYPRLHAGVEGVDRHHLVNTVGAAMVTAIAIDRHDLLATLLQVCPAAANEYLEDHERGQIFVGQKENMDSASGTPLMYASNFDRPEAVAMLLPHVDEEASLLSQTTNEFRPIDGPFLDAINQVQIYCRPAALAPIVSHLMSQEPEEDMKTGPRAVYEAGIALMMPGARNQHLVDSFAKAGAFQSSIDEHIRSVTAAVKHGFVSVVATIDTDFDWDALRRHLLQGENVLVGLEGDKPHAFLYLAERAVHAGQLDCLMPALVNSTGLITARAARALLHANAGPTLLGILLKGGFDPSRQVAEANASLAEQAALAGPAVAQITRSHEARTVALATIAASPAPSTFPERTHP